MREDPRHQRTRARDGTRHEPSADAVVQDRGDETWPAAPPPGRLPRARAVDDEADDPHDRTDAQDLDEADEERSQADLMEIMRRDIGGDLMPDGGKRGAGGHGDGDDDQDPSPEDVDARLQRTFPSPVPTVAITLRGRSAGEVGRSLRELPGQMDAVVGRFPVKLELRLDLLPTFSERINACALVLQLGIPVILTLRTRVEGGASTQTDEERQRFLLSALNALRRPAPPGSLIDLEAGSMAADPHGWGKVAQVARRQGFDVLLSHHDLQVSPERAARLLPDAGLLDDAPGGGALLWKSATHNRTWGQVLALLRAARRGTLVRRRVAVMGTEDPVARLVAPFLGTPLVYATTSHDEAPVASGQLPFRALVHAWARWGVRPDDAELAVTTRTHGAVTIDGAPGILDRATGRRTAAEVAPRWCLVGRPAWHSLSPAMHNEAARRIGLPHRYFPLELPLHTASGSEDDLVRDTLETLADLGVTGGNVTMPFKTHVARIADHLEPAAQRTGAVNTYRFDGRGLVGTNTDGEGIVAALESAGATLDGARVLIVGAGGSARAALDASRTADRIVVTNRSPDRIDTLRENDAAAFETVPWAERAAAVEDADVILQTTSLGMAHATGTVQALDPLDGAALRSGQTVLDLVYLSADGSTDGSGSGDTSREGPAAPVDLGVPLPDASFHTALLRRAKVDGATIVDGLEVLVRQAVASFRWWTGEEPDAHMMRLAARSAARIPLDDTVRDAVGRAEVSA